MINNFCLRWEILSKHEIFIGEINPQSKKQRLRRFMLTGELRCINQHTHDKQKEQYR